MEKKELFRKICTEVLGPLIKKEEGKLDSPGEYEKLAGRVCNISEAIVKKIEEKEKLL